MKIVFATGNFIEIESNTLRNFIFDNYDFHRVILEELNLSNSSFVHANLRGAFLTKANFSSCNFSNSSLIVSDLRQAQLVHANLNGANINGANFEMAELQGADMRCSNIETAKFNGAKYDNKTKWPENFSPEKFGCLKVP